MQTTTYTLGQRCMAYILLASFFLQSCNTWNAPSPQPIQGQATTGHTITPPEQPTSRLDKASEQALVLADESWQPANLPVEINQGTHPAPSTPIQQVPTTSKPYHKWNRSVQAGPKVVIQSPTTNSSLPILDNATKRLLNTPLDWKSREGHQLQELYLIQDSLYAKVADKASNQLVYELPVCIFSGISLSELATYPTQQISYYLHIILPKNQGSGRVIISQGGLRGGVKNPGNKGDEEVAVKESKQEVQEQEKPAPIVEKAASLQTSLPAIAISTLCHMGKSLGEEHYLATALTTLEEQAVQGDVAAKQRLIKKLGKLGTLTSLREKQGTMLPISWREKPLQALQEMVAQHYQQATSQLKPNPKTVLANEQTAHELGILKLQYYYAQLIGSEVPDSQTLLKEIAKGLNELALQEMPASLNLQRTYLSYLVKTAHRLDLQNNMEELRTYIEYVAAQIAQKAKDAAKAKDNNAERQALRQLAAKHYRKLGDLAERFKNRQRSSNLGKSDEWQHSYYSQASKLGDPIATYRLGLLYEKNGGLHENQSKAQQAFEEAAQQKYSLAEHKLALYHEKEGDAGLAHKWHIRAANQGHPISLYRLYVQASQGEENGKEEADKQQATFTYLIQAAQAGHAQTQYELGNYYWQQKQYEPAIKWYEKAAYQGVHEAYAYLGLAAAKGLGRQEDSKEALDYYMRAEKIADNPFARYGRARLYEKGRGVVQNLVTALNLYTEASLLGLAKAAYHAGRLHLVGETPGGDPKQAYALLKKATQGNIHKAGLLLGRLHEYGWGGKVDLEAAINWYQGAASAKNQDVYSRAQALYQLGWLYRLGKGVEANEATALNYFEQAAIVGKDKYVQLQQVHETLTKQHQETQEASRAQLAEQKADYEKLQKGKRKIKKKLTKKIVAHNKLQRELKKLEEKSVQEAQRISQVIKTVAGDAAKLDEMIKAVAPNGAAIVEALANNSTSFRPDGSTFTEIDMAVLVTHPRFKQLTSIDLDDRQLNVASLKILAPHLQGLTNLTNLDLQNNPNLAADGAKELAKSIQGLTNLQSLHLQNNKIGAEEAKALANSLPSLNNLQQLYLNDDQLGVEGAKALANSLPSLNKLTDLYLNNNQLGVDGVKALANRLPSLTNLQYLYLDNNQIGDDGAKALANSLPSLTNLQYLYLYNNQIGDEGAKALANSLPSLTKLIHLYLYNNQIGDEGAKALANSLPSLTNLQYLYLYNNQIGDEGAKALATGIKGLSNLVDLYLHGNQIRDEGAKALAASLPSLTSLRYLYLYNNKIGTEGAKTLANSLPSLTNLTSLSLENNQLGVEGAKALANSLPSLTNLQTINLQNNQIGDEGAKALGEQLQGLKGKYLYLSGNNISETTQQELRKKCPDIKWYF